MLRLCNQTLIKYLKTPIDKRTSIPCSKRETAQIYGTRNFITFFKLSFHVFLKLVVYISAPFFYRLHVLAKKITQKICDYASYLMICIPRDIGPICPSNLTYVIFKTIYNNVSNDFWLEKLSNNDLHKVS